MTCILPFLILLHASINYQKTNNCKVINIVEFVQFFRVLNKLFLFIDQNSTIAIIAKDYQLKIAA